MTAAASAPPTPPAAQLRGWGGGAGVCPHSANSGADYWYSRYSRHFENFDFPHPSLNRGGTRLRFSSSPEPRSSRQEEQTEEQEDVWRREQVSTTHTHTHTHWLQGAVARTDAHVFSVPPCRVVHNELEKNRYRLPLLPAPFIHGVLWW